MFTLMLAAGCASSAFTQSFWTPANMIHYKRVSSPVISNDGRWVAYVVATPRVEEEKSDLLSQIHLVATDTKQGRQLTAGDKSCNYPRFSPDGQFLSFSSGRGPDGRNQLYLVRLADGQTQAITAQKGNVGPYRWAPDGQHIAFTMSDPPTAQEEKQRRERKDWEVMDQFRNAHLYSVSLTKKKDDPYPVKKLTNGNFHVTSFDWSPDSKNLVFSHQPQSWPELWDRQDISTVDAQGGRFGHW
nr:hypothetical protein [Spirosoma sp. KNUC1025]